jgi:hypothetical protein
MGDQTEPDWLLDPIRKREQKPYGDLPKMLIQFKEAMPPPLMELDEQPLFPDPREVNQRIRLENQERNLSRKLLQKSPSCLRENLRLLHEKITKKGLPPPIYGVFAS